jgi:MoaA/NifB/PqqE/SkfB family radical SAM enzyme
MPVNVIKRDLHILYNYVLRRGTRIPLLASYKLTYRCNLRCLQCPFWQIEAPDPPFSRVVETLEALYARGNRIIIFEGGEPMLWKDGAYTIHDVAVEARKRFYRVGLTTNGTQSLDVPTDILWVSLDGLEETHNRLRGAFIFQKIMDNIAASQHPRIFAHITVNSQNANEVPELIRFLKGRVKGITIQFYYPYDHDNDLFLDFPTREKLLEEIIHLKSEGSPVLNSRASLEALKRNRWRCVDWLIDNADPDGSMHLGCYLKGRAEVDCTHCGFSPHTEISLAYQGNLEAIRAGLKIFF